VFILTFASAVAVGDAVRDMTRLSPTYKWPNDILVSSKKVCGILLESSFTSGNLDYVVVGIGVNVNQKKFPEGLSDRATSLSLEAGRDFDRESLLLAILNKLSSLYEGIKSRDFYSVMKRWREHTRMTGKNVTVRLGESVFEGVCEEISDDGSIVLSTREGTKKFTAGEVTIVNNNTAGGKDASMH